MGGLFPAEKPIKTYSRLGKRPRSALQDEDSTKRRHVDEDEEVTRPTTRPFTTLRAWLKPPSSSSIPSSPATGTVSENSWSDGTINHSSPPSSPPAAPNILLSASSEGACGRTLESVANVAETRSGVEENRGAARTCTKERHLVQMQINNGVVLQTTCSDCGMAYVKSNTIDKVVHDLFHSHMFKGPMLTDKLRTLAEDRAIWRGDDDLLICVMDRSDNMTWRSRADYALAYVQQELGAVEIPLKEIWSKMHPLPKTKSRRNRYRVFMCLVGCTCVGVCLVEQISQAHKTIQGLTNEDVAIADDLSEAQLGISRIWVAKDFRKRGIAYALLDCVSRSFYPEGPVEKDSIAFSPPTTSGARLARRWYGKQHGWLVYTHRP